MVRRGLALLLLSTTLSLPALAEAPKTGVEWSVVNPFRFYKHESSFLAHKNAYIDIVAQNGGSAPQDIVDRIERKLNTPDCADPANYDACQTTRGTHPVPVNRLGWASQTINTKNATEAEAGNEYCYGRSGGAYGYENTCERDYDGAGHSRSEDYVNPAFHAVRVKIPSTALAAHVGRTCEWSLAAGSAASVTRQADCDETVLFEDVPRDGGANVSVAEKGGAVFASAHIDVRDLLVLGLGESYASGEGNPDRPVRLAEFASNNYGGDAIPVRATHPQIYSSETAQATPDQIAEYEFRARARWTSPDCHRSQYSYQFRVALQLAIEDPHKAVTFVHLACSGARSLAGLFDTQDARDLSKDQDEKVRAQFDSALELLCAEREDASKPEHRYWIAYPTPPNKYAGQGLVKSFRGCAKLKRDIDLVMLSLGGNDVGFAPIVGYGIVGDASKIAPILAFAPGTVIPPTIGRSYLGIARNGLFQTAVALQDLLKVPANRVVQTDYEQITKYTDAKGKPSQCSGTPGLDVDANFDYAAQRIGEVNAFADIFLQSLANYSKAAKFNYTVTTEPFKNRSICSTTTDVERRQLKVPTSLNGADFPTDGPFQPKNYLPYTPRTRLFVTPNDSFLTANTSIGFPGCTSPNPGKCDSLTDILQRPARALFGGAFHRTAEGQAIVADAVLNQWARKLIGP